MTDDGLSRVAVEGHREGLSARRKRLDKKAERLSQRLDEVSKEGDQSASRFEDVPVVEGEVSELEYLRARATQSERDLTLASHDVVAAEVWLDWCKVKSEIAELNVQLGHVDYILDGPGLAGNDDQLAIYVLEAQKCSFEYAAAATELDFTRRLLTLTKRMHRDIAAGLKNAEQAEVAGPPRKAYPA